MRLSAYSILVLFTVGLVCTGCASLKMPEPPKLPSQSPQLPGAERNENGVPGWLNPKTVTQRVTGPPPDESAARAIFEEAERSFQSASQAEGEIRLASFKSAADSYKKAADRGRGFPIQEDALLMAAESQFFAEDYSQAADTFSELVKNFPNTQYIDKVDHRRFEIARYWLNHPSSSRSIVPNLTDGKRPLTDTYGHAMKLFDRIRFDDPSGKLSDDATMAAALASFEHGKYQDADEFFEDIRENFPSSEHQFQAHLIGLKAKLMTYGGHEYSGGALDESEKLIKTMVTQFPAQAREHYELLEKSGKDIRLKKAQREFGLAQYYDRRKEYRAARMHYENVRRDFSDTNLALEAESRLAQIDGRPDVPPQSLQWLADLFPQEQTRQDPLIRPNPTGR